MTCPRQYQLAILEGWGGSTIDLTFGVIFASAVETFKKALLDGKSWEDAQFAAFNYAFERSWDPIVGPFGGQYRTQWRCKGEVKYKNAKGNPAKCPRSHKGVWFEDEPPTICGDCGSEVEIASNWVPENPAKDRYTLLRLVVWYCEENRNSSFKPYTFPDGTPAVELSFRMPLGWTSPYGDPYMLCGHIDSLMTFGQETFITDNKTTKSALGPVYWAGYSPNIQVEVYDLAGSMLFQDLSLKGVVIEGAQTLQSGARFGQGIIYRNDSQREETLREIRYWIGQAEKWAADGYWPRNTAACYLCGFKQVCNKDPQTRDMYLKSGFQKREPWNPLVER